MVAAFLTEVQSAWAHVILSSIEDYSSEEGSPKGTGDNCSYSSHI